VADGIRTFTRETIRTGRYSIIGAEPGDARRFWFVLHGYGGLAARILRAFDGIVPEDTCVVAPEGLSRHYHDKPRADGAHLQRVGAAWMTREARELDIADNQRWLDGVHEEVTAHARRNGTPMVSAVLGFSQGVATAMRWTADGVIEPRCFVAWAGGLAVDVHAERFRAKVAGASVAIVAGDRDHFVTPALRVSVLETMRGYNAAVREIVFPGEHTLDRDVLSTLLRELPSNV
jgi:dienelactone hydrolase